MHDAVVTINEREPELESTWWALPLSNKRRNFRNIFKIYEMTSRISCAWLFNSLISFLLVILISIPMKTTRSNSIIVLWKELFFKFLFGEILSFT